jgi:putative hemolysin
MSPAPPARPVACPETRRLRVFAGMTVVSPAHAIARPQAAQHIIDVLIAERAPKLAATPVWPLLRPLLYRILDYAKAVRMADAIGPMAGGPALEHVSALLNLKVTAVGLEHIPAKGRAIAVCNHPTGIADGMAVYDALKALRPDLCFYANSDAHRVAPRFSDVLIPVEWVEAKRTRERTRETLLLTREAMEAERLLVIFPAGRLARLQADGRVADPPWQASAVSLARRYETPVIPIHVAGPHSGLFHFFNRFSTELRDMTLFHEFLNKQGGAYSLTIGPPIAPEALDGEPAEVTEQLKAYVERVLRADPDRPFS